MKIKNQHATNLIARRLCAAEWAANAVEIGIDFSLDAPTTIYIITSGISIYNILLLLYTSYKRRRPMTTSTTAALAWDNMQFRKTAIRNNIREHDNDDDDDEDDNNNNIITINGLREDFKRPRRSAIRSARGGRGEREQDIIL